MANQPYPCAQKLGTSSGRHCPKYCGCHCALEGVVEEGCGRSAEIKGSRGAVTGEICMLWVRERISSAPMTPTAQFTQQPVPSGIDVAHGLEL